MRTAGKNAGAERGTGRGGSRWIRARRVAAYWAIGVAGAIGLSSATGTAEAAILVTDRVSEAAQSGSVAGGASAFNESLTADDLDGPFSLLSDRRIESTRRGRFGVQLLAVSQGRHEVGDTVTPDGPDGLTLTVTRSTSGSTFSNGATASLTQTQLFQVDFRVTDTAVDYTFSGTFDPGGVGGTHRVWLGRVGGSAEVDYDSASAIDFDLEGQLAPLTDPAETYRFVVELDQSIGGNSGTGSGIDLQLELITTPEPGAGAALLALGVGLGARPRRR
ncbi:MAG: hypothetical protein AAF333_09315 [Planctomycetota bacterium]